MNPYLELLCVFGITGLGLFGAAVLLSFAGRVSVTFRAVYARALVVLPAFLVLVAAGLAHFFVPISIERLRVFVNSGWTPLSWWGVCMLLSAVPSGVYLHRHNQFDRDLKA